MQATTLKDGMEKWTYNRAIYFLFCVLFAINFLCVSRGVKQVI